MVVLHCQQVCTYELSGLVFLHRFFFFDCAFVLEEGGAVAVSLTFQSKLTGVCVSSSITTQQPQVMVA